MAISSPHKRASGATLIFSLFGVVGIIIAWRDLAVAWPPILFYAMLVWNDYYSVMHFSKIIPPNKTSQVLIDSTLVALHCVSIFFFADPFLFATAMIILFILAVLKYAGDLPSVKNSRALFRKVKIDALGALISSLALAGMLMGYPWESTIVWTGIFVCASVYVICINPLYRDMLGTS